MSLHLITAPARYPVTLIQAKAQCRVDDNAHDAELDALIEAVTAKYDGANGSLGLALVQQTWELRIAQFCTPIKLPLPPFVSLTSVKYLDTAGAEQTVSASVYEVVDRGLERSLLQPKYGQFWPAVTLPDRADAVRVRFVAGYASVENGALLGTIPRAILHALLLEIEQLYDGHDNFTGSIAALLAPHRIIRI